MANSDAELMRKMIKELNRSQMSLQEARPFGFMQQLLLKAKSPFDPNANKQLVLNQYSNDLYAEWQAYSKILSQRGGQPPTGRDFITWYGTSPQEPNKLNPAASSIIQALMGRLNINLDQPIAEPKLKELTKQLSGVVFNQATKISNKLITGATAEEEKQVFDIMQKLDDHLLRGAANLSLYTVFQAIRKTIGEDEQTARAIMQGWADFRRPYRSGTAPSLALPVSDPRLFSFKNRVLIKTATERQLLVQLLPTLLLHVVQAVNRAKNLEPGKAQAPTPKPKPTPELTPQTYAQVYADWQTQLSPLGFGPDDFKKFADKHFGIGS
jgi:hypothetical protein